MELRISDTYEEMSTATANFIVHFVQSNPGSLLCLPSGDTPTRTLSLLAEHAVAKKVDFSQCRFVGLDEWVGMDRHTEGSCQHYLYSHFFDRVQIRPDQIEFFNARATDLKSECKRVDAFILQHGGIDLIVLGVGVNGHIGLNEPGSSFQSYCHDVALEPSTRESAQKYFKGGQEVSRGITIGIRHILEAKNAVLFANGKRKAPVLQQIIEGPITESVPGSALRKHPRCFFFLDKDAASALKSI